MRHKSAFDRILDWLVIDGQMLSNRIVEAIDVIRVYHFGLRACAPLIAQDQLGFNGLEKALAISDVRAIGLSKYRECIVISISFSAYRNTKVMRV